MAETNIKTNGSFVGDSLDEFKKLPMWGKLLAVGVLAVVAYLAWRARSSGTSAQSAAGPAASGSQSPFPMVNGVPLLPSGVNPIYDNQGNLQGYQPSPSPSPSPGAPGVAGVDYGLIPFGQYKGPSYSELKPGTKFSYNGINYILGTGPQGKLYGTDPNGRQWLLYQPQSFYPGGSNYKGPGGTGSGPGNMFSFMENPLIYWVSAKPHAPATVPGGRK